MGRNQSIVVDLFHGQVSWSCGGRVWHRTGLHRVVVVGEDIVCM